MKFVETSWTSQADTAASYLPNPSKLLAETGVVVRYYNVLINRELMRTDIQSSGKQHLPLTPLIRCMLSAGFVMKARAVNASPGFGWRRKNVSRDRPNQALCRCCAGYCGACDHLARDIPVY